ncbi:MAG: 3-phosphoshikimate 1-carboxyvinyltransferase [Lachnospiraceae bacterium]|nr:3-phosphoshikimate 1-carboxyvinyltransferase [Lachnospiraceae bacterium]
MRLRIEPSVLKGRVSAPPSKSYAHRMMICSALAEGMSIIEGISDSEDMNATLDCINTLGAMAEHEGRTAYITGIGQTVKTPGIFDCRESGSTLRFMIPVALALYDSVSFTGSGRLLERGIAVYEELFSKKGISVKKTDHSIELSGRLLPGEYDVRGDVSSQFITGLLMALPILDGDSIIKINGEFESRPYVNITLDTMRQFGVSVDEKADNEYHLKGSGRYRSRKAEAEGDWSNAAFLYALKYLGNEIEILGLNDASRQGDKACIGMFEALRDGCKTVDISDCPDLGPVLFAYSALFHGGIFTGTKRLRIKESDRVLCMQKELLKFGIKTESTENTLTVASGRFKGGISSPETELDSHNDHRIAMALSVMMSVTGGVLKNAEAVKKSYPDFYDVMRDLGMEVFDETT